MTTRVNHYVRTLSLLVVELAFVDGATLAAQKHMGGGGSSDLLDPAFEVASIRTEDREETWGGFGIKIDPSGRFQASDVGFDDLVTMAYIGVSENAIVTIDKGAPKWLRSAKFDIQAKVDDAYTSGWDKLSYEQRMNAVRPMIRRLLVDRFHLKLAIDTQMTPVYVMVQAKGGAHLKEVTPPEPVIGNQDEAEARWKAEHPGTVLPGTFRCGEDKCTGHAMKMSEAVWQIAANARADRMVIDQTGLKGYYDFSFSFSPEKNEFPMESIGDDLGLKFERRSMPLKTYVIQSAEHPSLDGTDGRAVGIDTRVTGFLHPVEPLFKSILAVRA